MHGSKEFNICCKYLLNSCLFVYITDFLSPDYFFDPNMLKQVKNLELQGVSAAESGDLKIALTHFNQAIQILPLRASAYNNRAQVKRLQGDTDSRLLYFSWIVKPYFFFIDFINRLWSS